MIVTDLTEIFLCLKALSFILTNGDQSFAVQMLPWALDILNLCFYSCREIQTNYSY